MTDVITFPVKMSLDDFYAKQGCLFAVSGDSLDKCRFPHGRTESQRKRDSQQAILTGKNYMERRQEARLLYEKLVSEGKIIPKTKKELMIEKANGHPDNPSVQAARRMCEKRGIEWKSGRGIEDEIK